MEKSTYIYICTEYLPTFASKTTESKRERERLDHVCFVCDLRGKKAELIQCSGL